MIKKNHKEENRGERTTFMQVFSDAIPDLYDEANLKADRLPLFITKDSVLFPGNNIPIPGR